MKSYVLAVAILVTGLAVTSARAQDKPAYDLIQIGQSYRTPMDMVEAFAEARGHSFRDRGYLPPGVPIHAHWKNPRARKFASGYDYRVLCLVPYYDFRDESPAAAAGFFGLALEQNPDVRAYLVNHWPRRSMPMDEKKAWLEENLPKFAAMVNEANKQHPEARHPMCLVPRAEAFMDLLAFADQIPGFSAPATAYNDGGHQSNTSNYMFAAMEYAWIYGESPLGLPTTAEKRRRGGTELLFKLTDVQALALQRIGWRRLTSHPLSRVKLPADDQAPAAVSRIEAEATSEAVTLRWDEVQDAGTGVFRYIIRRSDGAEFDNIIARYRDTTVQPGRSYTYSVAGEDFAGNRSKAAKAAVDVPVDREAASIVKVRADQNAQTIRVVFDEPVDPTSATTVEHWRVKGLAVKAARLADADTVVLTTSPMKAGASYAIEVSGIADRAAEPNVTGSISTQFVFTPPRWKKFDLTDWDDTAVEIEGPQIRITAKGEGKFRSWGKMDRPAIAGAYRTVSGDFDLPLAITSQGQVAATLELKPYQRKGKVKTGIIVAEDIENIQAGNFAVFYLDDSTRFRLTVHRDWLVTARVIGAGLRHGDPRKNRQGLNLPVWIRLVREGTNLTGYYSLTGTGAEDWTTLGTIDARKMPEKVELGVFQTSGVADEHSTAMLDLRATGKEKSYTSVDN